MYKNLKELIIYLESLKINFKSLILIINEKYKERILNVLKAENFSIRYIISPHLTDDISAVVIDEYEFNLGGVYYNV